MRKDRPLGHGRHKGNGNKRAASATPCRNEEKRLTESTEESKRRHWAPLTSDGDGTGGRQTTRSPEAGCESPRNDDTTTADGACGDLSPLLFRCFNWTAVVQAFLVTQKALAVVMVGRILVAGGLTMPILTLGTTAAAATTAGAPADEHTAHLHLQRHNQPLNPKQPHRLQHHFLGPGNTTTATRPPESGPEPPPRKQQPARIELRLGPVGWPVTNNRTDILVEGNVASVAIDTMLIGGQGPGNDGGESGGENGLSDDYRILADFDSGAMRLWQGPPGFPKRRHLVPLGLCPGEHSVSAWGLKAPSAGSRGSNSSSTSRPEVSSGTPKTFVLHGRRTTSAEDSPLADIDTGGGVGDDGRGSGSGGGGRGGADGACDGSEKQPPLLGRVNAAGDEHGGMLCRVCAYTLEPDGREVENIGHDVDGGSEVQYVLTTSLFPRERKRLMLRTSFIAKFAGSEGAKAAAGEGTESDGDEDGRQNERGHLQQPAKGEQDVEWPIELREGDSPASVASEFVISRLGLDVRPRGAAPKVFWGEDRVLDEDGVEQGVQGAAAAAAAAAEGERVVRWVTRKIEEELAEREVRRSLKRAEAIEVASKTGHLKIILGATGVVQDGQGGSNGSDEPHSSNAGWLATDVNTLDVMDPFDFEYVLGPEGLADAFLAEHVWEHLSLDDAHRATRNCQRYLRPGGRLRLAVPDPAWHSTTSARTSVSGHHEDTVAGERSADWPNRTPSTMRAADLANSGNPPSSREDEDQVVARTYHGLGEDTEVRGRDGAWSGGGDFELPGWLSRDMLETDARDGHLVQYTPELLANVCWSAGLTPVLVEGGGAVGGGGRSGGRTHSAPSRTLVATNEATTETMDEQRHRRNDRWGVIKRSVAGGDPRGAVSIVMDCVKPTTNNSIAGLRVHPPEVHGPRDIAGEDQVRQQTDSHTVVVDHTLGTKNSENTSEPASEPGPSSHPPSLSPSGSSRPRPPVSSMNPRSGAGDFLKSTKSDLCNGTIGPGNGAGEEGSFGGNRDLSVEGKSRKRKESLAAWVAEASKSGRVYPSLPPVPDSPTTRQAQGMPSHTNNNIIGGDTSSNSTTGNSDGGTLFPSLRAMKRARARAFNDLLTGNVAGTLELCREILQEWPSDSATLLYQGAAMAQSGEWDLAWKNMERVLALSSGAQAVAPPTARRSHGLPGQPDVVPPRSAGVVPLDVLLAAVVNLASFAGNRASKTSDVHAATLFLVEGLQEAANRQDAVVPGNKMAPSTPSSSSTSSSKSTENASTAEESAEEEQAATKSWPGENGEGGGDSGEKATTGEYYEVGKIDDFTHILTTLGKALEGKGQLTSALRLYQRAILLGGHRDQAALHGLGEMSRRLLQLERERTRRRETAEAGSRWNLSPEASTTSPSSPGDRHYRQGNRGQTAVRNSARSRSYAQRQRDSCEWTITHPRPGQVFTPEDLIQVEFDLTLLDPGLPSAGSLFETVAIGGDGVAGGFGSEDYVQGSRGYGVGDVIDDNLGVIVCSHLEHFKAAHCLPRGQLHGVGLGWHLLTAEVYQLPSLRPYSCPVDSGGVGDGNEDFSTRTVSFCVGNTTTTCREAGREKDTSGQDDTEYVRPTSPQQAMHDGDLLCPEEGGSVEDVSDSSLAADQHQESEEDVSLRGGVAAARGAPTERATFSVENEGADVELPFCFMTLALNAMPFITHHAPTFNRVGEILSERATAAVSAASSTARNTSRSTHSTVDDDDSKRDLPLGPPPPPRPEWFWEWHVVEGVAAGRANHGNPYSRRRIPDRFFDPITGLSVDGTTEYLDSIVARGVGAKGSPSRRKRQVHVHRRCKSGRTTEGPAGGAGSYHGKASTANSTGTPTAGDAERERNTPGSSGGGDVGGGGASARSSCLWRDKIQMINSVAFSLEKECLLVQVDADELWTAEQLVRLRDMFLLERNGDGGENITNVTRSKEEKQSFSGNANGVGLSSQRYVVSDEHKQLQQQKNDGQKQYVNQKHRRTVRKRECAYFDCHFFIGPDLVTVTEDGWGHSTSNEWLRAWVFRPRESVWLQHAPPELARHDEATGWMLLTGDQCIGREETRERGLVFTHYAYVLEEQVRFKDEFYGHSDTAATEESLTNATKRPADPVSEWRELQTKTPPVLLADYLTWLRVQGSTREPRLLTTVADRPPAGFSTSGLGQWSRPYGSGGREEGGDSGETARRVEGGRQGKQGSIGLTAGAAGASDLATSAPEIGAIFPKPSAAPLKPFLQLEEGGRRRDDRADGIQDHSSGTEETRTSFLTHGVHAGLKEYDPGGELLQDPGGRGGDERNGAFAVAAKCGVFHLVVDGVVFQVDATKPQGISRVWASVLPAILGRLSEFEGTCLTLLLRGLTPPPRVIEEAFFGLPSERFATKHLPLYNPSFGDVADGLMLSWALRNAGATAFVSTLYTLPFWATTPNVVRLLLVHDVLPETFGWDMSKGEWSQKANAVAQASSVVAVSQHTAKEFLRVYPPNITTPSASGNTTGSDSFRPVWVAHNGVDTAVYRPLTSNDGNHVPDDDGDQNNNSNNNNDSDAFRRLAGLGSDTPYVMIVGSRLGYKNARAAYRALGAAASSGSAAPGGTLALVLVGGGPIQPYELELLAEVGAWSHVGVGSGMTSAGTRHRVGGGGGGGIGEEGEPGVVDDSLLAQGYAGAKALLHFSLAEGFGLTVLEAFACGCPVIAADIPPVREIAGLPAMDEERTAEVEGTVQAAGSSVRGSDTPPLAFGHGGDSRKRGRYDGASSPLEGGLVLVENPVSATQVWRAVRAVVAMDAECRAAASEALVRRARALNSWQPLADTLIKAAVDSA